MKWNPQWKNNVQDSGNKCSGSDSVSISFYILVFELRKLEAGKVISQNAEWFLRESGYGSVHSAMGWWESALSDLLLPFLLVTLIGQNWSINWYSTYYKLRMDHFYLISLGCWSFSSLPGFPGSVCWRSLRGKWSLLSKRGYHKEMLWNFKSVVFWLE